MNSNNLWAVLLTSKELPESRGIPLCQFSSSRASLFSNWTRWTPQRDSRQKQMVA